MSRLALGAVVALALAAGCAPKAPPAPPGPDRYPDFSYPLVPADLQKAAAALLRPHDLAWRSLQAGDPRAAERGFSTVLKRRPDFYPSEAGLAYVELSRGNEQRALERFDRTLGRAPAYLPALLGRAQTLLRSGRLDDALAAFEDVLIVDPSLADVRRRVDALRFRRLDAALAEARAAEQAGQFEKARAAYAAASATSPDSGFLYRDLARVERRLGREADAIEHVRRATTLDPSDGAAWLMLGDLLESRGDLEDAIVALEKARALEASDGLDARLDGLKTRRALAGLPEQYRSIPDGERLTRGQLAALIGVRLEPWLKGAARATSVLVTDIRGHWAQAWILSVARARVMEVFENHTFQPGAVVRRGDLAKAIGGVLAILAQRDPALGKSWSGSRKTFADLGAGNLYYPAASLAVAAGILDTAEGGAFQAGRVVTGAEGVAAVERLQALASRVRAPAR